MAEIQLLNDRTTAFINDGGGQEVFMTLLRDCVANGSLDALVCVRRLFQNMHGGITFNYELKAPAASALLVWKDQGLKALVDGTIASPEFKNFGISIQLLASVAAGEGLPIFGEVRDADVSFAIAEAVDSSPDLCNIARTYLVELILRIEEEDDVSSYIGSALQAMSFEHTGAAQELFAALSKRWLAVSTPTLDAFDELIRTQPKLEPVFQGFLEDHPQILDPLAIRVWPEPDLLGFKSPDFLVQRADGSYMVVEIECPEKRLVTQGNQLSADTTHAEAQATDYRRYLMKHFSEAEKHFPDFQEPDCLVVIGIERKLTKDQKQVLRDANNNRTHMRIAGFDWLLDRARTIAHNITQPSVEVLKVRVN